MQNKPNFPKSQMNVNSYNTTAYENKPNWTLGQNKPNSKPISEGPKMNANVFVTKDYENKTTFRPQKNKPKQSQWIKRLRSIFRRFILTTITQAPHINITALIVDPNTRAPPKMNKKKPEKPQVSVLTMGRGIFSSFFFAAGM